MPFLELEATKGFDPVLGPRAELPKLPDDFEPSLLDTAAAAFRQNNVVSSFIAAQSAHEGDESPVEDFDPFDAIEGTPYADFADRFDGASSPTQVARIQRQLDAEMLDRQTLAAAGGWGFTAAMAAGVTDPLFLATMLLPGGQEAAATRFAAFGRSALMGAVSEIPIEAGLQATQELRTPGESALNIGSAALLSGLLGAAIKPRVPVEELSRVEAVIRDDLAMPAPAQPGISTAGAASALPSTTLAEETIAAGGETISKTLGRTSPELRLLNSPTQSARVLAQELTETPMLLEKNLTGIATPQAIETTLKRTQGAWWLSYQDRARFYREYRKRAKADGEPMLSRTRFNEEVSAAMRRGDQHMVPEVARAARITRERIFEPWKQRAIRLGLLPKNVEVTGAMSYLMRQYNLSKIRSHHAQWIDLLRRGFQQQGLEQAEALDVAYQVTRSIMGAERGTLDLDLIPTSGRLKERQIRIPDEMLEPFLENNIDTLTQAYLRTLAPEIEIVEKFGDREMAGAFSRVTDEYGILKTRALAEGDEAKLKQLNDREQRDLADLAAIRDRLYGHYGAPKDPGNFFVRAGRLVRAINYSRLLGGQVISSFTDVARLLMIYGAPKMMASALKLATGVKALKLTREEARRMGIGLDFVLNSRAIKEADLNEASSFLEQRVMRRVSSAFSMASLQAPWNATLKSWASVMSQDDILRAATNGVSKQMRPRLASLGLDEAMLTRIAAQYKALGIEEQGLRFGRSDRWTDPEVARAFENAVLREADVAVLTPGAGDLPRVHSTEWGKAILQFKSFQLASTARLVIPMMQGWRRGDVNAMAGTLALFPIGALVYALKQITAGQPIELDPKRFAMEMVDKSGVLAWGGDVLFPALWQFGADDLSRWSDRQPVETLGGPVAGTIADAWTSRWPARVLDGDVSQADVHKVRRLMPGQNLFYLRQLINELEEEVGEAGGVAEATTR